MVVPTVLAINARRNCAWCSASGSGAVAMSNVVIVHLPWSKSDCGLAECVSFPIHGSGCGYRCLFSCWLGLRRHCARAHAGCRKPVLDGERRQPDAITGADIPDDTVLQIKSLVLN